MSKGSTWNIWDLHLHTPFSALNNQYGDSSSDATWELFVSHIEEAARERGVVAIGVTDYFSIEGYARLLAYQRQGRLPGLLLIPNVEFRIDKVVYRTKDASDPRRLNLHVLLSPSLAPEQIEEHFLHDLEFVFEQEPFQRAYTRKLKRSNLAEFGLVLQEQHEQFRGKDPFEVGCMNAIVSSSAVKEQLENRFPGDYMLVLAEESLSLLDWDSQHHAIRKQLMQMSHAIFSSNPKTREFCLGRSHPSPDRFVEEFKSLKPCLWGCDAHSLGSRFLHPDLDRFCWIKGDVTWEGLKQVLYEPADRVAIQQRCPEATKSIYTIDQVTISETAVRDSLSLSGTDLALNRNLVAIIGGRGSGKTALLDLIASCFAEGQKLAGLDTSFFHRLYVAESGRPGPPSQPIPVALRFVSGDSFEKAIGQDDYIFDATNVVYLSQNHFEEYSADPDKLNRHIIELVFEHFTEERRKYQAISEELESIDRRLEEYNLEIEHLSEEVSRRKASELDQLRSLEGSRQDLEKRIAEIEATQGKQAEEANSLSLQLDRLMAAHLAVDRARVALGGLARVLVTFSEEYQKAAPEVNAALKQVLLKLDDQRIRMLPANLPDLGATAGVVKQDQTALAEKATSLSENLAATRTRIAQLQGLDRLLADQRGALSSVTVQIADVQGRISETAEKEKTLARVQQLRTDLFAAAIDTVVSMRDFLQGMIEEFRAASPVTLENLVFDAVVDFKGYPQYLQNLARKLDNRVHSEAEIAGILAPVVATVQDISCGIPSPERSLAAARALHQAALPLRTRKAVSLSEYYDAVFSRFFEVGFSIEYSGKPLVELSMGERAIILLKVLLALGDCPLLIDQPEEHLDNRFIFDDLTPAFRDAKRKRQILIATHNANLVVNTDAEQIVIAKNTAGVLEYRTGTIEDLSIRETIETILEGGHEAFRKREERYGHTF
jgi:ABC-type cobalamin/Fe3+-siderophores transport system ATPase subunit